MPKTKLQKQESIRDVEHGFENSKLVVLTSYQKMPVSDVLDLRTSLKKNGVSLITTKKTILKKALKEKVQDEDIKDARGNISLAFGDNEISAAKVLAKFAKDHENLKILGGWLEKAFIPHEKVQELSQLLGKEELLAKLCQTLKSPISGFANVLSGNIRGLVNALNAIKDQKTN